MKLIVLTLLAGVGFGAVINDECPEYCFEIFSPVCGSDGVTYGNNCKLDVASCKSKNEGKEEITAVKAGQCEPVVEEKCPGVCTDDYSPVCGSDGKTYSNACQLSIASCQSKKYGTGEIIMESKGECKPAADVECPIICTFEFAPVCGSDGITYGNPCGLEIASCESKKRGEGEITEAHKGQCKAIEASSDDKCADVCDMVYSPVCGSDRKTYSNTCTLKVASCEAQSNGEAEIMEVNKGRCTNAPDCPEFCLEVYAPVCGSDGLTYSNTCKLHVASCLSAHMGLGKITALKHGTCDA